MKEPQSFQKPQQQPQTKPQEVKKEFKKTQCPDCGAPMFPAGGCAYCPSCGYSPCKN